jgi:predicted ester cyclase
MTRTTWMASALLVFALACKKEAPPGAEAPPPAPSMAEASKAPEPAKSASAAGEALAKRYLECWGFFSAKDWASFQTCYAPDIVSDFVDSGMPPATSWAQIQEMHNLPLATAFPDARGEVELTLINGRNGLTIALVTGTQTGPLRTPAGDVPPTGKKIGLQVAHTVEFDSAGKAVDKEWHYQDLGTMLAQLGLSPAPARPAADKPWPTRETVVATGDAGEQKRIDVVNQAIELFNKHDAKGMGALLAPDLVWSEIGVPVDWNHDQAIAAHDELFHGFSDLRIAPDTTWAAGEWVVQRGNFSGTNDGDVASMGLKKTGKKLSIGFLQLWKVNADGKISGSWGFWNSAAFAMQLGLVPPPAAHK